MRTANCNVTLPTQVYVKGTMEDGGLARIQWTSREETGRIQYVVERSDDAGAHYRSVYTVSGTASPGMGASYTFNDAMPVTGEVYYRIQLIDHEYHNYSSVILLSNSEIALKISGLINPFNQSISFNLTVPEDHDIQLGLYDTYGRLLMSNHQTAYKGINRIVMREPAGLQSGMYVLQVIYRDRRLPGSSLRRSTKLNN